MAAVPIYVWNGTAWQETGPTIPASPIKYQASAPASPSTGDIWIDSDADVTTGSQQFQRFRFVASGGETTISGVDANGATLAYTAGLEQVILNGAVLVRGQDYTATNGTSITGLSPALVASDVLEVFSFIAFTVANTYTQSQVDGLLNDYMGMRLIVPTSATNGTVGSSGAVTFTTASSVSLNGCFTSSYENYKILLHLTGSSTAIALKFNFRSAGTDNTSNVNYYASAKNLSSSASLTSYDRGNPATYMYIGETTTGNGGIFSGTYEVFNPQASKNKMIMGLTQNDVHSYWHSGTYVGTTSFDGFSINLSSGTITGTVRVYGYKN